MVVTDAGGNAEAVIDGETGLVVPPHNPAALDAAIVRLARDPELRRSMRERAKKRAANEFSRALCPSTNIAPSMRKSWRERTESRVGDPSP
jgi:glycosyltransferase involved in cell wall biosynthesis